LSEKPVSACAALFNSSIFLITRTSTSKLIRKVLSYDYKVVVGGVVLIQSFCIGKGLEIILKQADEKENPPETKTVNAI